MCILVKLQFQHDSSVVNLQFQLDLHGYCVYRHSIHHTYEPSGHMAIGYTLAVYAWVIS